MHWDGSGKEFVDGIETKKRCQDDEGATLEVVVALEEIIDNRAHEKKEVARLGHVENLADPGLREMLTRHQCRLKAKELLLERRTDVIAVGQHPVDLISLAALSR